MTDMWRKLIWNYSLREARCLELPVQDSGAVLSVSGGRILQILYKKFMSEQTSRLSELADPSIVYVTDLVSCHHKYHLRKLYPELSIGFEPSAIMGNLIHAGIESIIMEYGFKPEFQLEKHVELNGRVYVLKGRVDAFHPETREVLEIKSVKSFQGEPYEHHVQQLNIYLNLLDSPTGYLLYISHDKMFEYTVRPIRLDVEGELASLLRDEKHPRYAWECRYCPFRKICPYRGAEGGSES